MLHTVNKSPFTSPSLEHCLDVIDNGDKVMLYEDAIYAAMAGSAFEAKLKSAMKDKEVYALSADLKARGIDKVVDGVKVVGYDGFVDLVAADKVNNWF